MSQISFRLLNATYWYTHQVQPYTESVISMTICTLLAVIQWLDGRRGLQVGAFLSSPPGNHKASCCTSQATLSEQTVQAVAAVALGDRLNFNTSNPAHTITKHCSAPNLTLPKAKWKFYVAHLPVGNYQTNFSLLIY
jgi:hypothetical protein